MNIPTDPTPGVPGNSPVTQKRRPPNGLCAMLPAVSLLLSASTLPGAMVDVSSYTYLRSPSSSYPDSGGELTDNITYSAAWTIPSTTITAADVVGLSGWLNTNPLIRFDFAAPTEVQSVTVWAADSDNSAGVGVPANIVIRTPDNLFSRTFPIANPPGNGTTVPFLLSGFSVTTSSLIVEVERAYQWTMLSEVQFSSIPEPGSAGLLGLACAGLLFRRQRRGRGESAAQAIRAAGKAGPASRRRTAHGIAVSLLLTLPAGATVRWELSGTLNYVNPLLSGTFAVGQQFTISMDLDDSVPLSNGQRADYYTSYGSFENAVSNGNVAFSNYNAGFASTASHGAIQVRNNETDAAFGYDQLLMSFFSFEPGAVSAPDAEGFELRSVEFNFTDETAPRDMITGSGGTFPTIDVPFPSPDSFDLSKSSNAPYHFILRFAGGAVDGTNFIRGTIHTSSFTSAGGGFAGWPALLDLPENQRGPDATPAGDDVPNLVKYAIGIDPLDSAAGRIPQEVLESTVNDQTYPVVCFTRDTSATGVALQIEVSTGLDFTTDLGSIVISTEDLGGGLERVCVRSNSRFADFPRQFFRLGASEE